jgi:amino acid transporter
MIPNRESMRFEHVVISGFCCAAAGLCYSEMAALVPVSGSAYAYAYATAGELVGTSSFFP